MALSKTLVIIKRTKTLAVSPEEEFYGVKHSKSVAPPLSVTHPHIAKLWDRQKNGVLTPDEVTFGSGLRVWWKCPKGRDHRWQGAIADRAAATFDCPFCVGRRVSITNCLATCIPDLAKQWHATRNGRLKPTDVVAGSHQRVWWQCNRGADHVWQTTVADRTRRQTGCPYCSGDRVSVTNSLATCFPDIAAEWHPRKNGFCTPKDVVPGSAKKIWWRCRDNHEHVWLTPLYQRTRDGSGCPQCAGRRPPNANSLKKVFPKIAAEWHPTKNGRLKPDQVAAGSHKRVWWKCKKGPDHEWETAIIHRTGRGHERGCPFCANKRASITNCLATRYPEVAAEWHPTKNGKLMPTAVLPFQDAEPWWRCREGHEYKMLLRNRVPAAGCPKCRQLRIRAKN